MTGFGSHILAALMTPVMLYAGLAGAALPILIHLLNKRRFRRVEWAATDFLLEAVRENRRRLRIEELILLALRCLAMALIGLTLARWFTQPSSTLPAFASRARADQILLLDDSFSMRLEDHPTRPDERGTERESAASGAPDENVFSQAVSAALQRIEQLAAESPGDSLTILLASRPDRPLHTAPTIGQIDRKALTEELRSLRPSHRTANFPAALRALRALLDARQSVPRAIVYVFSDFQAIDWTPESDAPTPDATTVLTGGGPADALRGWARDDRSLQIVLVDLGRPVDSNLCVESIEPEQAQPVVGVAGRYIVRVRNYGREAHDGSQMQVYVGDAAQPPVVVPAVGPGHSVEVPVEVAFGDEGRQRLTVEVDPDVLPVDNSRSHVVPVMRALKILIVNGEGSPDPYQDEAFLLAVALRPEGLEFSGNDVTIVDESAVEGVDLHDVHAIVLANVYRLSEEVTGRLEQYAAAGGGVIVFLGDQVDADLYNRIAWRDGRGLLPASLGDMRSTANVETGTHLGEMDLSHPAMRRFADAPVSLFGDVGVWQWFACTVESEATRPAGQPANEPSDPAASQPAEGPGPARVLARLNDPEHSPLMIERGYGRGRVILVTTSADKEWNNLADHPIYLVLAMELVQQAARRPDTPSSQLTGEPIHLPLDPGRFQPKAMLKLPTFPATPAIGVDAQPDRVTGLPALNWTDTEYPGVYTFEIASATGENEIFPIAINVDPREGDLRRADRTALLASMTGLPVSYVSGEDAGLMAQPPVRRELWPAVLAGLAAVLMIEQILAWWFGTGQNLRKLLRRAA